MLGRSSAIEQSDGHQTRQRGIELGHAADLLAHQFELKGRQIFGHHDAMAVEDQAAARRDRVGMHAIALREFGIVVVPQNLQIKEPRGDGQQQDARP